MKADITQWSYKKIKYTKGRTCFILYNRQSIINNSILGLGNKARDERKKIWQNLQGQLLVFAREIIFNCYISKRVDSYLFLPQPIRQMNQALIKQFVWVCERDDRVVLIAWNTKTYNRVRDLTSLETNKTFVQNWMKNCI